MTPERQASADTYRDACAIVGADLTRHLECLFFSAPRWTFDDGHPKSNGWLIGISAAVAHDLSGDVGFRSGVAYETTRPCAIVSVALAVQDWLNENNVRWPYVNKRELTPRLVDGKATWFDNKSGEGVSWIGHLV